MGKQEKNRINTDFLADDNTKNCQFRCKIVKNVFFFGTKKAHSYIIQMCAFRISNIIISLLSVLLGNKTTGKVYIYFLVVIPTVSYNFSNHFICFVNRINSLKVKVW